MHIDWQSFSPWAALSGGALIVQASENDRAQRMLPKIVDIIHELGASVVIEGIESADQHALAVDCGTDLVQGYYYALPASDVVTRASGVDRPAAA